MRYQKQTMDNLIGAGYKNGYELQSKTLTSSHARSEIPQEVDTPIASFKARRPCGLLKKEEWIVTMLPDTLQFHLPGNSGYINISKDEAKDRIEFPREYTLIPSGNIRVKQGEKVYEFTLDREGRSRLCNWLPKKTVAELKNELRKWGIGLIILGGIHFALTGFLDPIWGILIACVGVLNLLITRRGMFIVNGVAILLAGIMNMAVGGGWKIFGMLQIIWGVQEIRKFKDY